MAYETVQVASSRWPVAPRAGCRPEGDEHRQWDEVQAAFASMASFLPRPEAYARAAHSSSRAAGADRREIASSRRWRPSEIAEVPRKSPDRRRNYPAAAEHTYHSTISSPPWARCTLWRASCRMEGGETLFANMYRGLPRLYRPVCTATLEGHAGRYARLRRTIFGRQGRERGQSRRGQPLRQSQTGGRRRRAPVVIRHPLKRPQGVAYVTASPCIFEGWSPKTADRSWSISIRHASRPEFTCTLPLARKAAIPSGQTGEHGTTPPTLWRRAPVMHRNHRRRLAPAASDGVTIALYFQFDVSRRCGASYSPHPARCRRPACPTSALGPP